MFKPGGDTKACTLEAMVCPDGSAVGRTGPNCEFTPCPSVTPTPSEKPGNDQVACTLEAKQCPDGSYVSRQGSKCEFAPCPNTSDTFNWKTYGGSNFLVKYPNNLVIIQNPSSGELENAQFGEQGNEKNKYIKITVSSGGETLFNNRKNTLLAYGIYNAEQKDVLVDEIKAWQYSGTDKDGSNFRQYVLFYKDNFEFEISNFGINQNTFDQILSTFRFD